MFRRISETAQHFNSSPQHFDGTTIDSIGNIFLRKGLRDLAQVGGSTSQSSK